MGSETLKYERFCYNFGFQGDPRPYILGENCLPSEYPLAISVIHNDEVDRREVRTPINYRAWGPPKIEIVTKHFILKYFGTCF